MCFCVSDFCVCRKWWGWYRSAFVLVVFCFCLSSADANFTRIKRESLTESLEVYLMNYGYMEKSRDGVFALRTEESVRNSLREMQAFAGLPVTGRLDDKTLKLMNTPRCGMPDKDPRTRRKRFTIHGSKWPYTDLTWSIRSRNVNNLNLYDVRFVISKALEVWSKHSKLTFTEVDSDKADILIHFHRGSHGDNFPFDGPGKVLAHAFFPTGVRSSVEVHFDADERWTTEADNDEGTNLFNVAAHEIGHSLGLSHSNVESALMYPWYKEMENGFDYELPDDDKQAIQVLYGAPDYRSKWAKNPEYHPPITTTTTTTTTTTRPPRVQTYRPKRPHDPRYPSFGQYPSYQPQYPMNPNKKHRHPNYPDWKKYTPDQNYPDRVIPTRYPFRHPETYPPRVHPPRTYPPTTYPPPRVHPTRIPDRNPPRHPNNQPTITPSTEKPNKPPPDTCDTSYDAISVIRREVFIFKDAYFWRIGNEGLMKNYPALIRRLWHGLPVDLTHVDAVYERNDGRIVFFVGDKYYVFLDNHVESGYPKPLTHLGIARDITQIDGAMVWGHNGKTYFYSRNLYWRFDEDIQKVELDYPRDMSMWKGVGTDIDAVFQWRDGKTYFFKGKGFWKFNDYNMRVENEEQKLSAPFWMGCTKNFEHKQTTKEYDYNNVTSHHNNVTSHHSNVTSHHSNVNSHHNKVGEKLPFYQDSYSVGSSNRIKTFMVIMFCTFSTLIKFTI